MQEEANDLLPSAAGGRLHSTRGSGSPISAATDCRPIHKPRPGRAPPTVDPKNFWKMQLIVFYVYFLILGVFFYYGFIIIQFIFSWLN